MVPRLSRSHALMMINMERRNMFDGHWWIFSWLLYMTHFTFYISYFVLTITHLYPYYPYPYKPILHSLPISTLYSHASSFNWLSLHCSDDIIVALGFVQWLKKLSQCFSNVDYMLNIIGNKLYNIPEIFSWTLEHNSYKLRHILCNSI